MITIPTQSLVLAVVDLVFIALWFRCIFIWRLPSEVTERIRERLSSIKASAAGDYSSPSLRLQML